MHSIRLRAAWQKQIAGQAESRRVDVPEPDGENPPGGAMQACYRRRFNLPTGLAESDRVYLSLDGWSGQLTSIKLNGLPLPVPQPPARIEITSRLRRHNQIELTLAAAERRPPRLSGEVLLLIESADG
ncbi:MAG: hypothetical protein MI861_16080 [Pirellulales bacterium]|nr:hypothetical protein [Pirellulales bacterium]